MKDREPSSLPKRSRRDVVAKLFLGAAAYTLPQRQGEIPQRSDTADSLLQVDRAPLKSGLPYIGPISLRECFISLTAAVLGGRTRESLQQDRVGPELNFVDPNQPWQVRSTPDIYIKSRIPMKPFYIYPPANRNRLFNILYKFGGAYEAETGINVEERINRIVRPLTPGSQTAANIEASQPASGLCKEYTKARVMQEAEIFGGVVWGGYEFYEEDIDTNHAILWHQTKNMPISNMGRFYTLTESGWPIKLYYVSKIRQPDMSFGLDNSTTSRETWSRPVDELWGYESITREGLTRVDYRIIVPKYLDSPLDASIRGDFKEWRVSIVVDPQRPDFRGQYLVGGFIDVFIPDPTRIDGEVGRSGIKGNVFSWDMVEKFSDYLLGWRVPMPPKPDWAQ